MWAIQVAQLEEVGPVTVVPRVQVVIASQHPWNVALGATPRVLGGLPEDQQVERTDKEVVVVCEGTISYKKWCLRRDDIQKLWDK